MKQTERMLYRYGEIKQLIEECRTEVNNLYAEKTSFMDSQLMQPRANGVRVKGGKRADPTFRAVQVMIDVYDERIIRLQGRLSELYHEYDGFRRAIDGAGLTEKERQYLEWRYVKRLPMDDIADRMGYAERTIFKLRKAVLSKLQF